MSHTSPLAEDPRPLEFFEQNSQFSVLICRKCKYAVRIENITTHLTDTNHRLPRPTAKEIQQAVQDWDWVDAEDLEVQNWPTVLYQPIEELPIFSDGLLCLKCTGTPYICRGLKAMKNHWHTQHQWSPSSHRGRPNSSEAQQIQEQMKMSMKTVFCQRIYPRQVGSHFIELRQGVPSPALTLPPLDAFDETIQLVRAFQI